MANSIQDQVIDFYHLLFGKIFSEPFQAQITDRIRRNAVTRQVQEVADAASQSLIRFFVNEQLEEKEVAGILNGFTKLGDLLNLDYVAGTNVTPESAVEELLAGVPCPRSVKRARQEAVYRVALHSVIQGLMLVGRVMAEWQRLKFSSTFELPRRVVEQLNVISEQLEALGASGPSAEDDRYELTYRDYLLQRFYRVEAGTVRMTTNMHVDLRELFVMPSVVVRPEVEESEGGVIDPASPMNLAAARKIFGGELNAAQTNESTEEEESSGIAALDQVKGASRNVIVGLPGSGKSTFFEWLQLKLAAVEQELVMGGAQAIPLLLRVRELNPKKLPMGVALVEKATASKDRAALMPEGWIERQMQAGRVLFMLDGLDETEPELCDEYVIPWLADLCHRYPECRYLISSRPVGYPPGALRLLDFTECDLLDFGEPEVAEYVRHWCTAIRLAQNEPEPEARREGAAEGDKIFEDFKRHPYIRNLAHNPLMLSAICLVNYFERGKLPEDRAMLYKLCVEGLLHHWDQRRGIRSEFTLDEKLRVCREVAIAMQADDRAEYEAKKVQRIFSVTLGKPDRAKKLFEHIRYRTGLLIERRAGFYAFAHLTFQEYLAAQAVYEGNRAGIDAHRLAQGLDDARWKEVIALYCGIASETAARDMIKRLIAQPDTLELGEVLADAYLSSGPKLSQDAKLRRIVLERIAIAPFTNFPPQLGRFPLAEVIPIANVYVGKSHNMTRYSQSYAWLVFNNQHMDEAILLKRLHNWRTMSRNQIGELIHLLHNHGSSNALCEIASDAELYKAPGPKYGQGTEYTSQAEKALAGLIVRDMKSMISSDVEAAFLQILRTFSTMKFAVSDSFINITPYVLSFISSTPIGQSSAAWLEMSSLIRQWAESWKRMEKSDDIEQAINALESWADTLESAGNKKKKRAAKTKSKSTAAAKRAKKTYKGRVKT